jgi:hypothetical protein
MQDFIVTDLQIEGEGEAQTSAVPVEPAPPVAPAAQEPLFSSLWIVLIAIAVGVLLVSRWRNRHRSRGLVIQDPEIGFLNLLGEEGNQLLAEDRPALAPLFSSSTERDDLPPPVCDVLVLYCDLARDGKIFATEVGLRQVLRRSRARILIVASENKSEYCLTAAQEAGQSGANLVLTMARSGAEFPNLFARLFADMKTGTPMPVAYNKLAPRGKMFLADAGELVFAPSASEPRNPDPGEP